MFYIFLYQLKKVIRWLSEPFFFFIYIFLQCAILFGKSLQFISLLPYTILGWFKTSTEKVVRNIHFKKPELSRFKINLFKSVDRNHTSIENMIIVGKKQSFNIVTALKNKGTTVKNTFSSLQNKGKSFLSAIQLPRISVPKVSIPAISIPTIKLPRVPELPKVSIPTLKLPHIRLPHIHVPTIQLNIHVAGIREGLKRFPTFFSKKGVLLTVLSLSVVFIGAFTWQSYLFVKALPAPSNIGKMNYPTSSHIYDRNGKLLYEIYNDQNRTPVSLKDLPVYIGQATIAVEDKDFYQHRGISIVGGMLRAVKDTYITKELQGGSTITQQLVKSSLLTSERTIERKVKEIILAVWTEQMYTKEQILEMYLNQVPYGGSAYGIEEAAKTYFGKSAKNLTIDEAALIAGLPQAPSLYSPYTNPELAKKRRDDVLLRMKQERYITEEEYNSLVKKQLAVIPPKIDINAPHFVFHVKQQLEEIYGSKMVEEGGLRVKTTLDLDIQQEAEKILKEELAKVQHLNIQNGAIVITKPSTGEILAMVGSADYFATPSGAFNVTTSLRQPGSTIKPVMYSLALESGFTAATIIEDVPTVIAIPGAEPYKPVNYDGRYHGKIPIRTALANSYNIPAVKVMQSLGVQRFIYHAEKMGIETWKDTSRYGLSLTLGGGEVRMVDMAEAFGVFASQGKLTTVDGVLEVEDLQGKNITYEKQASRQALDPGTAYIISDILSDNIARQQAFGSGSMLEVPGYKVAVKTGTTNDLKDNWTIGYTPEYVVTVWVGNNDNTSMNQYLVSGITGAAPIWNRVMSYLLNKDKEYNQEQKWMEQPSNVVSVPCQGRTEYFLAGTESSVNCGGNTWGQRNWTQNNWNRPQIAN